VETPISAGPGGVQEPKEPAVPARPAGGGIADEIRALTEKGSPSSLVQALDMIRSKELENGDFGRAMTAVIVNLMQKLYPSVRAQLPQADPPQTNVYSRILREAEKGNYTKPQANSADFLEYTLPFLAVLNETKGERLISVLPDIEKAGELNLYSVLAPYFSGLINERIGELDKAETAYTKAGELSPDCYPAAAGLARIKMAKGLNREAVQIFSDLVIRYPDDMALKRQLARAYYEAGDWSHAEPAIAEVLQRETRDAEFILMRAGVLVEQGQFTQAQAPLDLYASINPSNPVYLFLRARVQAEGFHNRDAALNYLRSLLRGSNAGDTESVYAANLLMESPRAEDQSEGRELLARLLNKADPSPVVLNLALQDSIRRENWREADAYLKRILAVRRSPPDLLSAYKVERGLGNNAAALSYARELHEKEPADEEGTIAYISALIDTGRQEEAGRMIESRLKGMAGGGLKSRYYYLLSRIRTGEDAVMNDLRSSLFEDPRNLDALIAMFDIYHRQRDERRAVYYLKQALAIAPENPQLKRYENEFAGLLKN
jgi:Tfp pilus assembly protein PilF